MKKFVTYFCLIPLIFAMIFSISSCSAYNYEAHGFDDYKYIGNYNSEVEIDVFNVASLIDDYSYINADYYYSYTDDFAFYNILERAIYYFEYTEEEYQVAKTYCKENLSDLGDECMEEYNGFQFYDYYGKRNKKDFYHGDDYPDAFKRVAFNDEKKAIVFLGVYTSDKRTDEIAEDVKDWGAFLNKYFFEFYSFG